MEVENSKANAARLQANRARDAEVENQKNQLEMERVQRERRAALEATREKNDREMVQISDNANNQIDKIKKINSDRVHSLDETQQQNYQALADKTASDLKRLDASATATIEAHKFGMMEKIKSVTDRSEDPFYRMKSLDPVLSDTQDSYTISVKLPEHEANNLYISGEGPYVKLALSRRFEDNTKAPEGNRVTKTNSYQTVVEQVAMPGGYDAKKMERSYRDGTLTIKMPKIVYGANAEKIKA